MKTARDNAGTAKAIPWREHHDDVSPDFPERQPRRHRGHQSTAPAVLAQGAAVELKLHSFVPPTHVIWTDVLTPWAADVAKRSNNQLTIKFFPAMQLGGKPPELYRQAVQGIADIDLHACPATRPPTSR